MTEEKFVGDVRSHESDDNNGIYELELKDKTEKDEKDKFEEKETVDKDNIRNDRGHEEQLDKGNSQLYERVNVICELDKESGWISGVCGLHNNMWAVLDRHNKCMKIFDSNTNTLKRYLRFDLSPNGATEIQVQHGSANPASEFNSKARKSKAQVGPDKQHLVAITLSYEHQIWFIDVDTVPARKVKTIKMKKECSFIEFNDDKIFVHCEVVGKTEIRHFIVILSTAGEQLKIIDNEMLVGYSSAFTIYNKNIYWTDMNNNRILCINVENGKVVSQFPMEKSEPNGITADSSGNIYVCGRGLEQIYIFSPNLSRSEALNLDTNYTRYSRLLCFFNGKLYIGYLLGSGSDTVTVVQINSRSKKKKSHFLCC